jgi:chemotaxis protein methyltransferase CheR
MNLTIKEIKEINNVIFNKFGIDYSNHSFISYKNRLLNLLEENNYNNSSDLIKNIENGNMSLDKFSFLISVPFSEMYRDPSMWRDLRDNILPNINGKIRIFLPSCTSGEELITLLIILIEEGYIERTKISVSACSKQIISRINESSYTYKQMELNEDNYKRYKGKEGLIGYGQNDNNKISFEKLINNINFIESRVLDNTVLPSGQDIVLYRNKLINFNLKMQTEILDKLEKSIRLGGYLIIGTMENLFVSEGMDKIFSEISNPEKIFKKIID